MNTAENMINSSDTMSAIDIAIAKAKARAASRSVEALDTDRPKLSPEEREASRVAARAERERIRAEKITRRSKGPVHMSKVEKAAAKLPVLSDSAASLFEEITTNLPAATISALSAHLNHFNRVQATQRAVGAAPLKVGQVVRIVGGDPRFIGQTGHLEKVQRIRCYVKLSDSGRVAYCFTSDVSLLNEGEELPETTGSDEELNSVGFG